MSSVQELTDYPVGFAVLPSSASAYSATNLAPGVVPVKGTIAAVTYVPSAAVAISGSNFQVLQLRNGTASGAGTTVIASRTWASGSPSSANVPELIALSGTPANLEVNQGDILNYISTLTGTLTLPAATLIVVIRPHR